MKVPLSELPVIKNVKLISGKILKKLIFEDDFTWFTYKEVLDKIDDVATGLQITYKLVPTDKVGTDNMKY